MQLGQSTVELLSSLDALSNHKLTCRNDLGLLIELATLLERPDVLERLSFHGKFVSKTYGIMQRVGKENQGYENLTREFTVALEQVRTLVDTLLSSAPLETKQAFSSTYLSLTPESLRHLLALSYDLSWYKNWLIDRPGKPLR